ncbi:MAG: hypothetical protein UX58_C0010G0002 [Candidatus Wolfebacteria bacterium GW2011_GWB2_46_69]|nr:MAG: hypothetical protein UX58_C0010G0002 [Candidatus Wolfebacteria bacterium GW2011_GWB2_46_69]KKU75659.1 MAG: hypothetical protein UY00_C0036G0009 [Candidatus Wolfebacteria bacterium GW2011_GWA1_47_6]
MGSIVLALCIFALPEMWQGGSVEFPMVDYAIFLIMMGMYVTAVPFFIALWQTLKLLTYIDQNKAFSELSVKALRNIKRCAAIIAVLYVGGVPLLFPIADAEDAPGMLIIGMIIACAPITVAVFAAVLQKLLQSAIDIKSENDLTV